MFQVKIDNLASHSATLSLAVENSAFPNFPGEIYANGANGLKGSFNRNGMTGNFTITRTGEGTATCSLSITIPGDYGAQTGSGILQGNIAY